MPCMCIPGEGGVREVPGRVLSSQLCAACPLLLRLAGNDSPRGDTDTAVRGMPVAAPTGWK